MSELNKSLKGGEFVTKATNPQTVFIPEDITEEQKLMAETTLDFIEKEVVPNLNDIDKQKPGLILSLLEKAGELGLLGAAVPEEYEGLGESFNTNSIISMSMGASHSFGVAFAAHTGIGTLPILYYGTEEQKKKYLPKLASGELKAAYCLTEPTSGSDALSAKTTAVLSEDGTHYVLNGQKMWITNGGFADILITFAKVDGDKFTGFIIPTNSEGFQAGEEENKMGIKGSSTRALFLDNVKVPVENVLGEIGKGHYIAFNVLNVGRYKLGAMTTGGAKHYIDVAVNYANERKQFGREISSFGAIKHKLAEMAIRTFVAEASTLRTSGLINDKIAELQGQGKTYSEAMIDAAEEYAIESSIMKIFGSEVLDYVVDELVQIHGGYGYSEEYPAARAYRDSRINRIFEGTNEINRLLVIDMLVKRSMKGRIDLLGPAMAIQKELMSIPEFGEKPTGLLEIEMQSIAQAKKAVLMIAGSAVQKFMQKLGNEQEIIMYLTDMIIDIYTAESALLRTLKVAQVGTKNLEFYEKMCKVYLRDALDRINTNGRNAISAFAEDDELKLLMLGMKRFTKLDPVNSVAIRREIANKMIEENKYVY